MARRKTTTPRSEQVRARRKAAAKTPRLKKRGKTAAASASPLRGMPPVVARTGKFSMAQPKRTRKAKTQRRVFEVATGGGVAVQLPAVPIIRPGWRAASLILTAALGLLLYHLWTAPLYRVQEITLQGNTYLESDVVNRVLAVSGEPIFAVSPRELEAELHKAFPGLLTEASVRVGLPAKVYVTVSEREPVLVWEQDDETLWIDAGGYAFAPAGENPGLITVSAQTAPPTPLAVQDQPEGAANPEDEIDPLLEVLSPKLFLSPETVAGLLKFHEIAHRTDHLTYDAEHGFGWHDQKRDWDVYLGVDLSNVAEKLNMYYVIRSHLHKQGIRPVMVSVEHLHAPYYRLEP